MEMGKLNAYYINSELKIGNTITNIASAYFSNATEEEFKNLLDNFLADNDLILDFLCHFSSKWVFLCSFG